jgi:alpha/beta superfamily hydrolase
MADQNAKIQSFFLQGPAGRLEALLNAGTNDAKYAAVVAHPHPLFGGTMHNKVVYHAAKALNSFGFAVLRFNFRGAGRSEGEHGHGKAEIEDVRAALNWMKSRFHLPMIFAGFSFGSSTGLRASCPDPDVRYIISLGTPIAAEGRVYAYRFLADCTKPKLFISGDHDQYGPLAELQRVYESSADPKKLVIVPNADHFFEGQLPVMRNAIQTWLAEQLAS